MTMKTGAFDFGTLLENGFNWVTENGQKLLLILGIATLLWAAIMLVRNLWSQSRQGGPPPAKWTYILAGFLVGGVLLFGGLPMITNMSRAGQDTIVKMGTTTSSGVQVNPNTKGSTDVTGSADLAAWADAVIGEPR